MPASFNKVILVGNLTSDPELQYTPNATARTKFSVAINRKYKDQTGVTQNDVTFVPVTVWGKVAESCAQYLAKGSLVMVEGRLRITTFENEQGEKRKFTEVVAQTVQFLSWKERGDSDDTNSDDEEVPF